MQLKNLFSTLILLLISYSSNISLAQAQKTINPAFTTKINNTISHSVPIITCQTLEERLDDVTLLDAREFEEYKTSHIKGAKYIGYNNFSASSMKEIDKNATIVIYCSIGYRSEKIGEQLQSLGYSKVYNLYGGIFEWLNEDNTIINQDGQPTNKIHTYNKEWSKWVEQGDKVY